MSDLTVELFRGVSNHIQQYSNPEKENKLDAIVCASGGWAGDVDVDNMMQTLDRNPDLLERLDPEEEYAKQSAEVVDRMMRMNFYPVVAGSQVGRRFLSRGGMISLYAVFCQMSEFLYR